MKTIFILILLGFHIGLCGQKHIEIKATFEPGSPEITPQFKVDVKNLTDTTLLIINNSTYLGDIMFTPVNSYFVADYVLKNGKTGVISGIPLMEASKNKRIIKVYAHQSIENKFWALEIRGLTGFTGIFPHDFDFSSVAKVRFRLTKLFYELKGILPAYPDAEYTSNWVTLKGR